MTKRAAQRLRGRLIDVWANFVSWADEGALKEIVSHLDDWLDEYNGDDRFGTEGQCDPRGDGRDCDGPRI